MQQSIFNLTTHNAEFALLELGEELLVSCRLVEGGMEGTSGWLMGLGGAQFPQGSTSTDD
jgi:hypothetical protein